MTEDDAKAWLGTAFGGDAVAKMQLFADIVFVEAGRQNLIAPSTLPTIWARHIVDSAQLVQLALAGAGVWLDIGSGAGFPGLVVAALTDRPVWLVEPRKKRAEFLERAAHLMGLAEKVRVECARIEEVTMRADVISARAVSALDDLFGWAYRCASSKTQWILPKGRTAREEVVSAQRSWHGLFHVEHSITDPESLIVIASGVARR